MRSLTFIFAVGLTLALAGQSMASTALFEDDFESGSLSNWTGKAGGTHHGQIVVDPHDASNNVVNFTQAISAGDLFQSTPVPTPINTTLYLSFDYLGATGGSSSGGFIGIASQTDTPHFWLAGTQNVSGVGTILPTDGQWHHYDLAFASIYTMSRVMLEDFVAPGYNAYFDNVRLATDPPGAPASSTAVPVPGAGIAGVGLVGLLAARRRRRAA